MLSEFATTWPDLESVPGRATKDRVAIGEGHGRDILGHPFNSVAWLATQLASRGVELKAGQVVMTGSVMKTIFPEPGQAGEPPPIGQPDRIDPRPPAGDLHELRDLGSRGGDVASDVRLCSHGRSRLSIRCGSAGSVTGHVIDGRLTRGRIRGAPI